MTELNVVLIQNEIRKLKISEEMKRREHTHMQDNVQDAWDKLVNLRSHIALFNSAIEEVRIEEATYYANNSLSEVDMNDLTSDMATKLSSLHALREKVRLKEGLKAKVALMEEQLTVLRRKLSAQAEELSKASSSMISDASGSATNETLATLNQHRLEDSMSARTALLISSKKLEDFESEYLQNVSELELVELEINEVMKWNPDLGNEANSNKDNATPPQTPPRTAKTVPMTPSNYCPVSLHEVLSGQARITRINGEDASKYRVRLEKRVAGLKVLDDQLNKELNQKNADLLKIKSMLKDVELQRLRKEVELNNLEKQIENAVAGVGNDMPDSLQERALALDNASTPATGGKSQSEKNINMAIQMLGQDLMQNVVMPSTIKPAADSGAINMTMGFGGEAPFTPLIDEKEASAVKSDPVDVNDRLEKLAKNLEESSEFAMGQKELIETVRKQQQDLETLREAQAKLMKLVNPEDLSAMTLSRSSELSDSINLSSVVDTDPSTRTNAPNETINNTTPNTQDTESLRKSKNNSRNSSPLKKTPTAAAETKISEAINPTGDSIMLVANSFETPAKALPDVRKPLPINTTNYTSSSIVSLPTLDPATSALLAFDDGYLNLLRKLNNCREKLTEAQSKEYIDKSTGTMFDTLTAKSTSFVEVGIIAARELPITKKFNNSSDPFIELFLVSYPGDNDEKKSAIDIPNKQSFSTKVLHTGIRPQWRETFRFTELLPPCNVTLNTNAPCERDGNPLGSLSLFLLLMDHNKSAPAEIIGECSVALEDFLDQEKHTIWINVKPPVVGYRQKAKIPDNCAIKTEIRVIYNKQELWSHRYDGVVDEMQKYIEDLKHQQVVEKQREEAKKKKDLELQHKKDLEITRKQNITTQQAVYAPKNAKDFMTYKEGDKVMKSTSLKRINALVHNSSAVKVKQQKTASSPPRRAQTSTPQRAAAKATKSAVKASPFPVSKSIGDNNNRTNSQDKTPAKIAMPLYRIGGGSAKKTENPTVTRTRAISPTRYSSTSVDPHNVRTSVSPGRFLSPSTLSSLSTSPASPARRGPNLSIFKRSGAAGYDHGSGTHSSNEFSSSLERDGFDTGIVSPSSPRQNNFHNNPSYVLPECTSAPQLRSFDMLDVSSSQEVVSEDDSPVIPLRASRSPAGTPNPMRGSTDSIDSQTGGVGSRYPPGLFEEIPSTPSPFHSNAPTRESPGAHIISRSGSGSGSGGGGTPLRGHSPHLHVAYTVSPHKNGVKIVSEPSQIPALKVPLHRNVQHVRRNSVEEDKDDDDDDDNPPPATASSSSTDEYECY